MTVCGIKQADGVCVMGKCPYIKMCCTAVWDKRKSEPQTNEEWFCSLPTEEKAKMLGRVSFCDFCPHQLSEHCAWTTGYSEGCVYGNKENEELWLTWLKEKHE